MSDDPLRRAVAKRLERVGADRLRQRHAGTRLGVESRVAQGWAEYRDGGSAAPIEQHAREVHYDVLRREGFSSDRAREIAAESAEVQARELERMRGEGGVLAGARPALAPSGFDIRSILPSALTDER